MNANNDIGVIVHQRDLDRIESVNKRVNAYQGFDRVDLDSEFAWRLHSTFKLSKAVSKLCDQCFQRMNYEAYFPAKTNWVEVKGTYGRTKRNTIRSCVFKLPISALITRLKQLLAHPLRSFLTRRTFTVNV